MRMCTTDSAFCSALGADPADWSHLAPRARPSSHIASFDFVRAAISSVDRAMPLRAIDILRNDVPDAELFEWFDKHAQYAYRWRCAKRGIKAPATVSDGERGKKVGGDDNALSQQIYARDCYRCRYCGSQMFAWPALLRLQTGVGRANFRAKGTRGEGNASRSGVAMVFRPQVDHVFPASRGGQLDVENLVTCCWPCNNGKKNYTVEELGIADPRSRSPIEDEWDGLRFG
jgi:hypothetical protein